MGYTLIERQVTSGTSTGALDFDFGTTYDEHLFTIHKYAPVTDERQLTWQVETGTDTDYDKPIQSINYLRSLRLDGTVVGPEIYNGVAFYQTIGDQDPQWLMVGEGGTDASGDFNEAHMRGQGEITFYAPHNTTHVKHWLANGLGVYNSGANNAASTYSYCLYTAGYVKETLALTTIRFAPRTGNFQAGVTIAQYGLA